MLKCEICRACIHAYVCTCPDNLIRGEMCKHIHLVSRYEKKEEILLEPVIEPACISANKDEIAVQLKVLQRNPPMKPNLRKELIDLCEQLIIKIDSASEETLTSIRPGLKAVANIMNVPSIKRSDLEPKTSNEPVNKKMEKQKRFYSTKKKRKTASSSLSKPNYFEVDEVIEMVS